MGTFVRRTIVFVVIILGCSAFWIANASAAIYTVTNTHDAGPGSLRDAIQKANATLAADTIKFAIPLNTYAGIGYRTIPLQRDLDPITHPLTIDGTSEPGYSGTPLIRIDNDCNCADFGLYAQSPQVKISGLSITGFGIAGVSLSGGHDSLTGNWIGLAQDGNPGGNVDGVIVFSDANLVGGATASARNVISGNSADGVVIPGGKGNVVSGNFVGLGPTGEVAMGNGSEGIVISSIATATMIGGMSTAARNVISANGQANLSISDANGNFVQGNYIGTDATGAFALPNARDGLDLTSANDNTIGRNVISGHPYSGISMMNGSSGDVISANLIGTSADGTSAIPNGTGIGITGPNNMIGGTSPAAGNVISGNGSGVSLYAGDAHGNTVAANLIGVTKNGTPLGNQCDGIDVDATTAANTIGGTTPGARNVISANGFGIGCAGAGVQNGILLSNAQATVVEGNYIGTNLAGTSGLGNYTSGVKIAAGSVNNVIGGTTPGARNVISGNGVISHQGAAVLINQTTNTNNVIEGNFLGTTSNGTAPLGNNDGVMVESPSNTIGGTSASARNVISGNLNDGIVLLESRNLVGANYIGTNASGSAAVPNFCTGVSDFYGDNTIGGPVPTDRNVISGNGSANASWCSGTQYGIDLNFDNDFGDLVGNDYIGTNAAGTAALGNAGSGIAIEGITRNTAIGGSNPENRNVISGNRDDGIDIFDSAHDIVIQNDFVGTNAAGTGALGNVNFGIYDSSTGANNLIGDVDHPNVIAFNGATTGLDGVQIDGTNGVTISGNSIFLNGGLGIALMHSANHNQSAPVITSVSTAGGKTTVSGTVDDPSQPDGSLVVELFVNVKCDSSGYGEGQKFLKTINVPLDDLGDGAFAEQFSGAMKSFAATTTNTTTRDTSQFSNCM